MEYSRGAQIWRRTGSFSRSLANERFGYARVAEAESLFEMTRVWVNFSPNRTVGRRPSLVFSA